VVSGVARNRKRYGDDRLVYEVLESTWWRYHARHCPGTPERECTGDWLDHAVAAGFTVIRYGRGGRYVALTGPGLTEGVDEAALTANASWEVVTGKPGSQTWTESVTVFEE